MFQVCTSVRIGQIVETHTQMALDCVLVSLIKDRELKCNDIL